MSQYRELLKEVRRNRGTLREERTTPLKRRKKRKRAREESSSPLPIDTRDNEHPITVQHLQAEPIDVDALEETLYDENRGTDSDVIEVKPQVFLNTADDLDLKYEPIDNTNSPLSNSGDDFDSDEFENVDLDSELLQLDLEPKQSDNITVSIKQPVATLKKLKRNVNIVSREEKAYRKSFHISTIAAMACHGLIRNHWINDEEILEHLRKYVPREITRNLNQCLKDDPDADMSFTEKQIHSRKLLDCVKLLMESWNHDFIVNKEVGIYRKKWNEIESNDKSKATSRQRFRNQVLKKRGSRDVAAQGFVSLLRSVKLHARLVFSLQPPDFTDNTKAEEKSRSSSPAYKPRPQTPTRSLKGLRPGEKLLQQFRNKKITYEEQGLGSQSIDKESEFPVFWAEVWDKFSKKWISVDAICFKYIEVVRVTSKFEPPSTDERNQTLYVLGYDNNGAVRDLTRRYSKNYNAKTRKKRITREPRGELWYNKLITLLCSEDGKFETGIDLKELEYFNRKSLQEGMPNSLQDFKNHPIYVLEDQLKSNEIIFPKTPCGRTRKKNSKTTETIPVYKRENVHTVRSAKAWYLRGRLLKPGERPMLTKTSSEKKTKFRYDDDLFGDDDLENANDEDNDKRLYAESQTELYIPPPVVDGEVPKNAYGNIDLYVPSMLPANACYRDSKLAIKAAKSLGIDYVEACVGFEFSKGGTTTAKMKGIVVAKEYEDAMSQVEKHLQLEEEERAKKRLELNALRSWRLLLTKLRIRDDLNREYGNIDGIDEVAEEQFKRVEEQFAKLNKDTYDSEDDELYGKYYDSTPSNEIDDVDSDDDLGGGFLPEDGHSYPLDDAYGNSEGGQVPEYENYAKGGYGFSDAGEEEDDDDDDDGSGGGGFILDDYSQKEQEPLAHGAPAVDHVTPVEAPFEERGQLAKDEAQKTIVSKDEIPMETIAAGFLPNIEDDEYLYDPSFQLALLQENQQHQLNHQDLETELNQSEDDLYTISKTSKHEDDEHESVDSLELANQGIEDEEQDNGDDEYYDDNEFEYSDDD